MKNAILQTDIIDAILVEDEHQPLSPSRMKNFRFIIGIVLFGIISLLLLFLVGETAAKEAGLPPDAYTIGEMIQRRSILYQEAEDAAAPLREQLAALDTAMEKLKAGATGLDQTLCEEYGVKYIRSATEKFGTFEKTETCSFR